MALAFVFSVKHYLRGEDGVAYSDFQGVLPSWFYRIAGATPPSSNAATRSNSKSNDYVRTTPEGTVKADATKRVRAKRSKQRLPDPTTPLLSDSHHTVEFLSPEATLPLPLLYVG